MDLKLGADLPAVAVLVIVAGAGYGLTGMLVVLAVLALLGQQR